jgi:hypothetical protein
MRGIYIKTNGNYLRKHVIKKIENTPLSKNSFKILKSKHNFGF